MDRLMTMYGSLPDFGKQNALWDMCAETVGYRNASRYAVPPGEDETPTVDASIAQLENQALLKGGEINILDGQNNLVHAKTHLEAEMPLIEQAQQDPNMLMEVLPGLERAQPAHDRPRREAFHRPADAEPSRRLPPADPAGRRDHPQRHDAPAQDAAPEPQAGKGACRWPGWSPAAPRWQRAPGQVNAIDPATDQKIQGEIAYREAKIQSMNEQAQARLRSSRPRPRRSWPFRMPRLRPR